MSALLCMPHQKHYAIAEAFHEAVSDAIALSVSTPKHLQTLGLVQKSVDDTAHDINFLFSLALDKVCTSNVTISLPNITASPSTEKKKSLRYTFQVVFLPFALAMDVWRWDIFNKNIVADQYNCHWWLLRFEKRKLLIYFSQT